MTVLFPDGEGARDLESDLAGSGDATDLGHGPDREGSHEIAGERDGMRLGSGALIMVNSDTPGIANLLIGAPGDPMGGQAAGSLTLQAVTWEPDAAYGDGSAVLTGAPGSSFGCSAQHLHRDALFAVGACTRSAEAGEQLGAVYLFDQDLIEAGGVAWQDAIGRIEGDIEHSELGRSLASGDFDGDGLTDLIVGAPAAEGGRGRVYMIDDIAGAPWRSAADAPPLARGTAGDDGLGSSLLLDGDLTGDGHEDLVLCAPGWDIAGVPSAGACGIIAGGGPSTALDDLESSVVSVIYGSRLGDSAGDGSMGVQIGPFLGGDGLAIAVALPGSHEGSGSVLIVGPDDLDGFVSATAATLRVDGDGRFGHSMAALPGGGLLVGAPEFGQGGAAFALLPRDIWMPSGEPVHASDVADGIYLGMDPDSGFGSTVTGGRDLDGDQWPDIAVGAPGPTDASPGSILVTAVPAGWPVPRTSRLP